MGYYDFPHTRNYDSDLGFLIKRYNELDDKYDTLIEIYKVVQKEITDVTMEQLQKWLDDGTMADIINHQIFDDLNTKIDGKTNIEEFNQNRIQGTTLTYGMWEKGANAAFVTNDFTVRPGVSGLFPPSAVSQRIDTRDSVALFAFGLGKPPLINQSVSSFTANSVALPTLVDSVVVDPKHNSILKDLDFIDTIIDVFVNGIFTYYGFTKSYNSATKTFTLRDGTGFYKYGESALTTYIPPNNSKVLIGNVTSVWGSNIIAQDTNDAGANGVRDLCGLELMTIRYNEKCNSRSLLIVAGGDYENGAYIVGDGSQTTKNGAFLTRLTEKGIVVKPASADIEPAFWGFECQRFNGNTGWAVSTLGQQTSINTYYQQVSDDNTPLDWKTTFVIFAATDGDKTLNTNAIHTDGRTLIIANYSSNGKWCNLAGGLGGKTYNIGPNRTAAFIRVGTLWYSLYYVEHQ